MPNKKIDELLDKLVDVAMTDTDEYEGGADEKADEVGKICAVIGAMFNGGEQIQDSEPDEIDTENKADDENDDDDENKKETEMTDSCGKKTQDSAIELAGLINDLVDEKLEKFKDSQKTELKAINDAYSEVSEALGTSFDYSGMSRDELYKFGYETITGVKLADDMDSVTAFKLANAHSKPAQKVEDSAAAEKTESAILKALNNF